MQLDNHSGQATELLQDEPSLLDDIASGQARVSVDTTGIVLGKVLDVSLGKLIVTFPGCLYSEIEAMALCIVSQADVGKVCAIQFIGQDIQRPIVMGLVNPVTIASAPVADRTQTNPTLVYQGKQIVLSAEDELVLQCGETCIVMSSEGWIQIRAPYIDSQATATNRLKGGSVQVN